VLRRIIRRGLRYARRLNIEEPVLYRLAPAVLDLFDGVYFKKSGEGRYALDATHYINVDILFGETLRAEEERFGKTMTVGADRVGSAIEDLRRRGEKTLSGEAVFRLYDTFGIPIDLIEEIASDEGLRWTARGSTGTWRSSATSRAPRRSFTPPTTPSTKASAFPHAHSNSGATRSSTSASCRGRWSSAS
jgi:alanyl-tRNA synthetase